MRVTHTYVELELSRAAYEEIRRKLKAAGYHENFPIGDDGNGAIDMHGIAVTPFDEPKSRLRSSDVFGRWGKSDLFALFAIAVAGVVVWFFTYAWALKHGHH